METSLDIDALTQLGREQKTLLDTVDSLRGLGVELDSLPQIVVVGDKSSGKSSVLEAISRVPFPVKSSLCTRCPTELVLRTAPEAKIAVKVRSKDAERDVAFNKEYLTSDALPTIIEKMKDEMGIGKGATDFSEETLHIEISGPELPHLTLVDLPGLYHAVTEDESKEGIEIVRSLSQRYMKQKNTIILAVIAANTDIALQEVLTLAKTYDPTRERTIGVITKPDQLQSLSPEERKVIQLAQNQEPTHRLRLGWHILRNRSSMETDENNAGCSKTSNQERDETESKFLGSGSWTAIPFQDRGVEALREKLGSTLTSHVQASLPELIDTMEQKLKTYQHMLAKLGKALTTDAERRGYIFNVVIQYRDIAYVAIRGIYDDKFFRKIETSTLSASLVGCDGRKLRAVVRNLNCAFDTVISTKGARRTWSRDDSSSDQEGVANIPESLKPWVNLFDTTSPICVTWKHLKAELETMAANGRGNQFPGSPNDSLALELFRDQTQRWHEIASKYIGLVLQVTRIFVQLALDHITGSNKVTRDALYEEFVDRFFDTRTSELDAKLIELIQHYQGGNVVCLEDEFQRRVVSLNKLTLATRIKQALPAKDGSLAQVLTRDDVFNSIQNAPAETMDWYGLEHAVDIMSIYYQVSFTLNSVVIGLC